MKLPAWFIITCILLTPAFASEKSAARREARELREKIRQEQVAALISSRQFILKADYIRGNKGQNVRIISDINFIMIDSSRAAFQQGSDIDIGYNGLGGFTREGPVQNYSCSSDSTKFGITYKIRFMIFTTSGSIDISLDIAETGKADATVRGNKSWKLYYSGSIHPLTDTPKFIGQSP
jgi:hypothetical protein